MFWNDDAGSEMAALRALAEQLQAPDAAAAPRRRRSHPRRRRRVGRGLDAQGDVTGGWGPWLEVPDWGSWENQGAGIALADLDGDGQLELVAFQVDNAAQANGACYQIGWELDADGEAAGGWSPWVAGPDWLSWENQGADAALIDVTGGGRPQLVFLAVYSPEQANAGLYGLVDLQLDLDEAATRCVWRLLSGDSRVLAIHAALLRTGKVLFFAGSSSNPDRAGGDFRSVVWDPERRTFFAPPAGARLCEAGLGALASRMRPSRGEAPSVPQLVLAQ